MARGGIYFKFIYDIEKNQPMYVTKPYLTSADYEAQSQAVYNIICSKDVFTSDYPWARNCIAAMSTHRNGFQAVYRIASEVIPALNNTPIPNNPPIYPQCSDIYDNDKKSRNYWVLKFIKKREETDEIEKSEAFINGLANTIFHAAAKDLRTQLNSYRRSDATALPPDLTLNSITMAI